MSLAKLRHQDHYIALTRELREAGYDWREEFGGKHPRLIVSVNQREEVDTLSGSPSDGRATLAAKAEIRRRIRQWKADAAGCRAETASAVLPTLEVEGTMDDMPPSTRSAMELIAPVDREISGITVQTVNARDLHAFLRVGKDFSTWIKDRIGSYGFNENVDYTVFPEMGEQVYQGVRTRIEYAISIDMAKELSMVERNSQGRAARRYFIDCERRAREAAVANSSPSQQVAAALNDPASLRALLLDNVEKVLVLEAELDEARPAVAALDHLTRSEGTFCITDAAKGLDMRPGDLFSFLQSKKWIYRRAGTGHWVGYQDKVQQGLLDHRVHEVTKADGSSRITEQVRVTAKGMTLLGRMLAPVLVGARQ